MPITSGMSLASVLAASLVAHNGAGALMSDKLSSAGLYVSVSAHATRGITKDIDAALRAAHLKSVTLVEML